MEISSFSQFICLFYLKKKKIFIIFHSFAVFTFENLEINLSENQSIASIEDVTNGINHQIKTFKYDRLD